MAMIGIWRFMAWWWVGPWSRETAAQAITRQHREEPWTFEM
jgi:hypothetical protein